MRALIKEKNNLGIQDAPIPTLTDTNNVLIRVAVSGLCRTDVYVAEGLITSAKDKLILGHEFSGTVEAIGNNAAWLKPGDRVAVMPVFPLEFGQISSLDGAISTMLGLDHDGSFSEYIAVPSPFVHKLPDNVTFKQGAYLEPVAASLAPLNAGIMPQQKGLIYGENRISRLTERVLHAKGFTNIDVFDDKDYASAPLAENSYDFIIETFATTETMERMVKAVKPNGKIILKSRQHVPVAFNINTLVMKDISLHAVNYGEFEEGISLIASGKLQIDDLLGDVYALDDYARVFALSKQGEEKKIFMSAANEDVWNS